MDLKNFDWTRIIGGVILIVVFGMICFWKYGCDSDTPRSSESSTSIFQGERDKNDLSAIDTSNDRIEKGAKLYYSEKSRYRIRVEFINGRSLTAYPYDPNVKFSSRG